MTSNPMMLVAGIIEFGGGLLIAAASSRAGRRCWPAARWPWPTFMVHAKGGFWPIINKGELAVVYCFLFLYIAARGLGALQRGRAHAPQALKASPDRPILSP
jgi:putative oxidoreductase